MYRRRLMDQYTPATHHIATLSLFLKGEKIKDLFQRIDTLWREGLGVELSQESDSPLKQCCMRLGDGAVELYL